MTFYAGCFISASFATGAIGKSIRQVAIPILIYRSQQERKNAGAGNAVLSSANNITAAGQLKLTALQ